ncbi:MAG TPA: two-component regulator propeller domain-containing protein, partial [Thermoanaerobaculia bacterium]
LEDSHGNLWAGTAEGVLNRRAAGEERFAPFLRLGSQIASLAEGPDGALWIGTKGGGLYRVRGRDLAHYTTKDGLSGNSIISLLVDRRGVVWAATMAAGLNRFEGGHWTTYHARDGLGSDSIFSLFEDRAGALWIGTFGGGVTRFADGRFRSFTTKDGLPHDVVMSTYQDGEGTYWFATRGGLARYRDGRFTTFRQKEGVFHDAAQRVLEDGRGYLWLTSNRGVFRVSLSELAAAGGTPGGGRINDSAIFGTAARMIPAECNGTQHGAWKGRDGRLWFATIKGLAMADPARIEINTVAPRVVLEQVVADGTRLAPSDWLRLRPGTDRVEFAYTALSFRNPLAVRFRFRLEGFDRDWVDAGPRRSAFYTNLPPGHYRFRVLAANEDGVWSPEGAAANLILERHFWQTIWFRLGAILAVAGLAAVGYRLRVRRLEARERLRTALVEAQLDALQFQLRPHFLFNTLNSILPLIGKDPERARQMVIRLGELLRLSLRSEDTPLVPLEEELAILDKYLEIEKVRFRDRLEIAFDVDPAVAAAKVPTFLLQPLAENAIKHGLARRGGRGRICIAAHAEGGELVLAVRDNGPGLKDEAPAAPGIGLANTRRRLEALYPGAHDLALAGLAEGGCEVRLRFPLELARAGPRAVTAILRAS